MFDLRKRIQELCILKEITSIYHLAQITGVSQSTLQSMLNANSARTDTIERICLGLNITIAEFFTINNTFRKDNISHRRKNEPLDNFPPEAIQCIEEIKDLMRIKYGKRTKKKPT